MWQGLPPARLLLWLRCRNCCLSHRFYGDTGVTVSVDNSGRIVCSGHAIAITAQVSKASFAGTEPLPSLSVQLSASSAFCGEMAPAPSMSKMNYDDCGVIGGARCATSTGGTCYCNVPICIGNQRGDRL